MEEKEKKDGTNWGCLIAIAIFVIVNIVSLLSSENEENLSDFGAMIICAVILIGLFYFFTHLNSNDSKDSYNQDKKIGHSVKGNFENEEKKEKLPRKMINKDKPSLLGCISAIIIFAIVLFVINKATEDHETNYAIGAFFAVALSIGIGILIYFSYKDE